MHGNLCATGGFILEGQGGFQEERRGKTRERSEKKLHSVCGWRFKSIPQSYVLCFTVFTVNLCALS